MQGPSWLGAIVLLLENSYHNNLLQHSTPREGNYDLYIITVIFLNIPHHMNWRSPPNITGSVLLMPRPNRERLDKISSVDP